MLNIQDKQHLEFIYDRLVHVYKDDESVDFMLKFSSIIDEIEIDGLRILQADHTRWFSKDEFDRLEELVKRKASSVKSISLIVKDSIIQCGQCGGRKYAGVQCKEGIVGHCENNMQ